MTDLTVIAPFKKEEKYLCEKVLQGILELEDLFPFSQILHDFVLYETDSNLALNEGVEVCQTDWIFFQNIYQMITPYACIHANLTVSATFGNHGSSLLPMGFFCKTSIVKENPFIESKHAFYKTLPAFIKTDMPLIREKEGEEE